MRCYVWEESVGITHLGEDSFQAEGCDESTRGSSHIRRRNLSETSQQTLKSSKSINIHQGLTLTLSVTALWPEALIFYWSYCSFFLVQSTILTEFSHVLLIYIISCPVGLQVYMFRSWASVNAQMSIPVHGILNIGNEFGAKGKLIPGAIQYRKDEIMRYVPDLKVHNDTKSA